MEPNTKREPALYRDILRRVWQIIGRWKWLLAVGFVAAFAGNGEQYDVIDKNIRSITDLHQVLGSLSLSPGSNGLSDFWPYFRYFILSASFLSTNQLSAVLLFVAVMIAPITLAQGAIISAIKQAAREEGPVTFGAAWRDASRHFLPILAINVVSKVAIYGLLAIVSYPLFTGYLNAGGDRNLLNGLVIAAFFVLIPLQIVVSFLAKFASAAVVVHGRGFKDSIKDAWHTLHRHWLIAIEMTFLLVAINIAVSLLSVGVVQTIFPPEGPFSTTIFFLVVFLVGSFLAAFQFGCWTLLYIRIEDRTIVSKLARWADIVSRSLGAARSGPQS